MTHRRPAPQIIGFTGMVAALILNLALFAGEKRDRPEGDSKHPAAEPETLTFRVPVQEVVVHTLVTKPGGEAVFDLNASHFKIYEDGKLQEIRSFSRESYLPALLPGKVHGEQGNVAELAGAQKRYLSVFIDDVTLANPKLIYRVTEAMRKFLLERMTGQDLVALLTASGRVRVPFSDNRQTLLHVLERLPHEIQMTGTSRIGCPVLTDLQAQNIRNNHPDGSSLEVAILETILCERLERNPNATEIATTLVRARAAAQHEEVLFRNRLLLESLHQHLRSLRRIEGRKSLIFFSDGFLPEDLRYQLQDVVDAALRSGVILNALDVRELYTGTFQAEDRVIVGKTGGEHIVLAQKARMQADDLNRQLEPLRQVTAETGGILVHSSNDLFRGLRTITESQSFYYVLSYASPAPQSDGRYHRIRVEVSRPGLRVVHREGYFAPREELTFERHRKQDILEALQAPADLKDIPVDLSFKSSRLDDDLFQLAVLARVPMRGLRFLDEDARHRNLIHLVVVALDQNGQYVDGIEKAIQFNLTEPGYTGLLQKGLVSRVNMKLPAGRYRVQAVVRESVQARMGSSLQMVEVP
jgi:VWFA-related protein